MDVNTAQSNGAIMKIIPSCIEKDIVSGAINALSGIGTEVTVILTIDSDNVKRGSCRKIIRAHGY